MSETKRRVVVRRGRQWAPLQGSSEEANKLARLLRERVQEAGLTLNELYAKLTPEHFGDRGLPSRATVGRRLSGERLETDWEVVEAILDVTSRDQAEYEAQHATARELWDAARHTSIAPFDDEEPAEEEAQEEPKPSTLIINGEVRNLSVHYGDNDASTGHQQQVIELQAELLEARRQLADVTERLHQSQLALAAVMREVEEIPGTFDEGTRSRIAQLVRNLQGMDPAVLAAMATRMHSTH
ncbi:hypothetical protein [Streptomyces ipomoeae]|uniref:hypothetical protein n=1 Tax=Streptomyces ipomoeae TaxID=103232 RepID=UPI0011468399|nr:hypothetical protein [Streptomyces ipomoeae]MDX2938150.1 hypothetical protein [Streptomyces ipomoeae]TQE27037.1 hypothetical protein SipoB123_12705 [Streptomyces ipomoeae]